MGVWVPCSLTHSSDRREPVVCDCNAIGREGREGGRGERPGWEKGERRSGGPGERKRAEGVRQREGE